MMLVVVGITLVVATPIWEVLRTFEDDKPW